MGVWTRWACRVFCLKEECGVSSYMIVGVRFWFGLDGVELGSLGVFGGGEGIMFGFV